MVKEPEVDGRRLVGGVVVEYQMHVEVGGDLFIDAL